MNNMRSNLQAVSKLSFTAITPAPRYFAHDIIDPIFKRLERSNSIDLNYRKKGHPERGSVEYYIFGPSQKSNGVNDAFAKVARSECMCLKITQDGHITLSQYIPSRFGRRPYGEITADPKEGNTKQFRSLLNTFIYELERYTAKRGPTQNLRANKTIRHLVIRENPLNIRPTGAKLAAQ